MQVNNTWEMSAVPYIPVPGLVEEHLTHLRNLGVTNFMLSWTLGGYPGGNLRLLTKTSRQIAKEDFGAAADMVLAAYSCFDEGFRHFPFNGTSTIYVAPQNYGPVDLLYLEPTGYRATMIGFPYDDLTGWRGNYYPEEVFEQEFQFLCDQWATGLACLAIKNSNLVKKRTPFKHTTVIIKVVDVIPAERIAVSKTAELSEEVREKIF